MLDRLRAALGGQTLAILLVLLGAMLLLGRGVYSDGEWARMERSAGRALSRIEGAGEVEVIIRIHRPADQNTGFFSANEQDAIPCGAIAVADGADDPWVRMELTQALCALLGLQSAQVSVLATQGAVR